MNIAISAVRTKDTRINRYELVSKIQSLGHKVKYVGQKSRGNLHPDYEKFNVEFLEIPLARTNTNPFREIRSLFATVKILKNNKIDGLIVYGIRTFPTMVLAAKLAGVKKVVCIVNGSGRLFQLNGLKGFITKCFSYPMLWLSFLFSNHILFQNPDDYQLIKRKGLLWRRNCGLINGSGVNLNDFENKPLPKKQVFMMISRLTGSKGVNEYIESARYIKQKYPESIFYLIGPMDNEDQSININLLNKSVKDKTIELVGKVEDVKPYLEMAKVFVLPSYYPEGIPRSILEAMSMGRPIITTNTSGCRETVVNEVNGFLIKTRDSKDLSDKMIWMIENNDRLDEMGNKSREICEKKYDVNNVNNKIIERLLQYNK